MRMKAQLDSNLAGLNKKNVASVDTEKRGEDIVKKLSQYI